MSNAPTNPDNDQNLPSNHTQTSEDTNVNNDLSQSDVNSQNSIASSDAIQTSEDANIKNDPSKSDVDSQDPIASSGTTPTTVNLDNDDDDDVVVDPKNISKNNQTAPKDSTLKASFDRILNGGKLRIFIFFGSILFIIICYAIYSIIFSKPDVQLDTKSGEFIIPKTNVKAADTATPEQAEYIKNKQGEEADQAAQSDQSYVAGFVSENASVADDYNALPDTQPGLEANQNSDAPNFFDETGKAYSVEEAITLSNEGKKIQGVTVGKGSINDATSATAKNSNKQGGKNVTSEQKPVIPTYVVQPYTSSKTGLNESSQTQVESLNKSTQQVDQWTQEYAMLRFKKAQYVASTTQLAFKKQLDALDSKDKVLGNYNRSKYANQSTSSSTNQESKNTNKVSTSKDSTSTTTADQQKKIIGRAGETYRTILTSTVNTDEGTEVLARIQNGPLKGETITGTVKATESNIQFVFTRVLRKNKPEIAINGVARQIGTNALGMADVIKKHTLQRYTSLVVASALSGVGEAYEQTSGSNANYSSSGVVVASSSEPSDKRIIGNAVGELGSELSNDIKSAGKRKTTYITNSGKVFNLFLNQDLVETPSNTTK